MLYQAKICIQPVSSLSKSRGVGQLAYFTATGAWDSDDFTRE